MERSILTGFLALSLLGCGDDGGAADTEMGSSSSTSSSDPTTGTPTTASTSETDGGTTAADPTTGEPGSSNTSEGADSSSGSSSTGAESSSSTGEVAFAMTSPSFEQDGLLPFNMHVCEGNVHPQLDWVGAPDGTMSFGIFFADLSIDFEHSAIWNIPGEANGVPSGISEEAMPEDVPGAVQCRNWTSQPGSPRYGYGGPGSCSNEYIFTLYALDVPNLDDEIDSETSRPMVQAALEAHALASVSLSGTTRGSECINMCSPIRE